MSRLTRLLAAYQLTDMCRHLLVLLFEAERAWAHSRELKTGLQATNPDKQGASHSARVRHHANSRLSRAIHYASTLLSLLPSSIDVGQRAQLHSYLLYLRGLSCFERTEWQAGLSALSVSMTLLLDLSERQGSSAHESALANEWVDEVSPLARFCAYKLEVTGDIAALCRERAEGGDGLKLVEGWDGLQADLKKGNGQKRPDVEVQWRGVKIEIRNAELADAMTNTEATISKLAARRRRALLPPVSSAPNAANKKRNVAKGPRPLKSSSFDAALLALSDAESISRRLVEDNAVALSRSQSSRFEASSAPLRSAHSYIAYRLLSVRIERDSALVRETLEKLGRREAKINDQDKRPTVKDVEQKLGRKRARVYPSSVKLLDGIILSLEQMRELTLVESDVDLSSEVDAKISFVSARRCVLLSSSGVSHCIDNGHRACTSIGVLSKREPMIYFPDLPKLCRSTNEPSSTSDKLARIRKPSVRLTRKSSRRQMCSFLSHSSISMFSTRSSKPTRRPSLAGGSTDLVVKTRLSMAILTLYRWTPRTRGRRRALNPRSSTSPSTTPLPSRSTISPSEPVSRPRPLRPWRHWRLQVARWRWSSWRKW